MTLCQGPNCNRVMKVDGQYCSAKCRDEADPRTRLPPPIKPLTFKGAKIVDPIGHIPKIWPDK